MTILIFLMAAAVFILYVVMARRIDILEDTNLKLMRNNTTLSSQMKTERNQLKTYLTQDPIAAYGLLQSHVADSEKREKRVDPKS